MDNWTMIVVRNWNEVDTNWCLDNIEGQYVCMGNYWYFENKEDALVFALRWKNI